MLADSLQSTGVQEIGALLWNWFNLMLFGSELTSKTDQLKKS